ncbi:MAG: 1-deoxy-D-xylulose-5-phosphate reductoisomerase [Candidatus Omnitrophica bacterium CG23_combo_of_CG06-09_8_20_14_all_40_11]|nr:MAG: 1-deoxy-D-xylulose-5-phosphate reductoisomerase [Candidatus Omnitrophica bacterium CG23_combo_of_CG06-09_8_20_14_all_40_11]
MKRIAILGSTGSIGQNTLEVIRNFPDKFCAVGLSTNSNVDLLYQQIKEFYPEFVCVKDESVAAKLDFKLKSKGIKLFIGEAGLEEMVQDKRIDKVVLAISGASALPALLKAIESGKDIALANKEAFVIAGPIIMKKATQKKIKIIPIDSEQSAIWQCLKNEDKDKIKNIYLTASGGPFRQATKLDLKNISVHDALRHPRWKMGPKISVDSANLMNKGLEVLETMYLFDIEPQRIKVLIHPQSIIHSMVEFEDGIILAQLSVTDMRIPIQYALTYPQRLANSLAGIDFCELRKLDFQEPDFRKFPCLGLAYRVADEQGTLPAVLNAANEVSVDEFLKNRLGFISIPKVIERVLDRHRNSIKPGLDDILEADNWARREAYKVIDKLN